MHFICRKLQILVLRRVYFASKLGVVLEVGGIKSEEQGAKGYNIKYGYIIEY